MSGGNWTCGPGIGSYKVNDGDVLGFRWGLGYCEERPELHSFSEICHSSAQGGGIEQTRYFTIAMSGNCTKEPFVINVKERDGGESIWEATPFLLSGNLVDVEYGVGIRILLRQISFGKEVGLEKVAVLFTDKDGNASFFPQEPGRYKLEFEKGEFLREGREVEISECKRETAEVNKSAEIPKPEKIEVAPNNTAQNSTAVITVVNITSPATALVNSTVIVRMTSGTGEPLPREKIIVEFQDSRRELLTNESGEASFKASEEGVYSYSSPNYSISLYTVTNVIKPSKVSLESPAPQATAAEEKPASVGMATAGISPEMIGAAVVLILVLLYLIQRVRK